MNDTLEVVALSKAFGGREVIVDVSLQITPGKIVGLLGPNGAGKTTIFKLILGLLDHDRGTVRFGRPLDGLPMYQRCRLGLGYLPQGPSIFRGLTVQQNLVAVLDHRKETNIDERVDESLSRFGLTPFRNQRASLLSGGERRKLEFARALCADPKVLLLDEPFAGVDPIAAESIARSLKELAGGGIGLLVTDHNVRDALRICDTVHILAEGRILESGTPSEVVRSNTARQFYLGTHFS